MTGHNLMQQHIEKDGVPGIYYMQKLQSKENRFYTLSRASDYGNKGVGKGEAWFDKWAAKSGYLILSDFYQCLEPQCMYIFNADYRGMCPKCLSREFCKPDRFLIPAQKKSTAIFIDGSVHEKLGVYQNDQNQMDAMLRGGQLFTRITNDQLHRWMSWYTKGLHNDV